MLVWSGELQEIPLVRDSSRGRTLSGGGVSGVVIPGVSDGTLLLHGKEGWLVGFGWAAMDAYLSILGRFALRGLAILHEGCIRQLYEITFRTIHCTNMMTFRF